MEKSSVGILISAFVAILIGIVAVSIIAGNVVNKTDLTYVTENVDISSQVITNDPSNIANGRVNLSTHSLYDSFRTDYPECEVTTIIFKNQSGTTMSSPTQYNFTKGTSTAKGYIVLANSNSSYWAATTSNITTAYYGYCADDYIPGWSGTVMDLIPGFFALGILIAGVFVMFWIFKKEGIDIGI
jgi:hypothetical protein